MIGEIVYNGMVEIENNKINYSIDLKNTITGDMYFVKVTNGSFEYSASMTVSK